jgi:hypothetical protein
MISQFGVGTPAAIALLGLLALQLSDHRHYAKAAAIEQRDVLDASIGGIPPCSPAIDGEVLIQQGAGECHPTGLAYSLSLTSWPHDRRATTACTMNVMD